MRVTDTLQLFGNAVSQTSKIRRERILKTCDPDITNLADKQELFQDTTPNLFGDEMKVRVEAVWVVHKGQSRQTQRQFFQGNCYPQAQRGGGYGYQGS